jgi:cysteine-rich repeat protein
MRACVVALALVATGCQGKSAPPSANAVTRTEQALTPGCGNGVLEPELGEACDDGNLISGDGCNSTCVIEAGFVCIGERPSACSSSDWSDGPASYGFAQHSRSLPTVSPFVGTDFWTDFPFNLGDPNALALKIAGVPGTTGAVKNTAGSTISSFTIPAGGVSTVTVDVATFHVTTNNSVTNQGVHITANAAVRVIASNEMTYSTDTWAVWGTQMLGSNYIIEDAASSAFGWEINFIGVQSGTTVVVKDTAGTTKATISLNQGQTYQFTSSTAIVGYSVTSNNPIAVIAGTQCTNDVGSACDMTAEQLAPINDWARSYVVAPTFNSTTAKANHVVVASANNTTVIITASNGTQQTVTLNAQQSSMFATGTTAQLGYFITADKPVALASNIGDPGNGWDPSLVTWPPLEGYVSDATMSTSGQTLTFTNFLSIITRTAATSYITVNGTAVTGWNAISTTGYSWAQVAVSAGDNTVHGSNGVKFAAVAVGGQSFVSYGYSSPYNIASIGGSTTCYLGTNPPDYEGALTGSATADQDDLSGTDDEDALTGTTSVQLGASTVSLTVPCNENYFGTDVPSTVFGWIDFNRNGTFEAGERASASCVDPSPVTNGSATLTWASPTYSGIGTTFIRLRICENGTGCDLPTGTANSGEVEDHVVHIGTCGDGYTDTFESCDDGNTTDGDGCSSTCTAESGFTCSGNPSTCLLTQSPAITGPASNTLFTASTVAFSGTCTAGATVHLKEAGSVICTAACSGGTFSCTSSTLVDGSHSVVADQQMGSATSVASAAVVVKIDTVVPPAPVISAPTPGTATNDSTPTVSGTCESGASVRVSSDGSVVCTVTCTLQGTFSCDASTLADGSHTMTAALTDVGSRVSPASASVGIIVDTAAPSTPTITAPAAGVDPGTASPSFTGACETGDTVRLIENLSTVLCATTCVAGAYTCPSTPLSIGSHTVQARQTDAAGNLSPYSAQRTFPITAAPVFPPTFTAPAEGSMLSHATASLSCVTGDTVTVSEGAHVLCSGACVASAFTCALSLADGAHAVTATQTQGSSTSSPTAARHFTLDQTPPAAPVIAAPVDGSSSNVLSPAFSGTAEAGSLVAVSEGAMTLCTASADAHGNWSCTSSTLGAGLHTATAVSTDAAGNASAASVQTTFNLDRTAPAAPSIHAPSSGASVGQAATPFDGTAEAGATVTVTEGSTTLCVTAADAQGHWSCHAAGLADGAHTATAVATDAAGNASEGTSVSFAVDTTAPSAPSLSAPASGALLRDPSPTLTGAAEPGSTVTVLDGATVVCTATADAQGNWSCQASGLAEGAHALSVQTTDAAGNRSAVSATTAITVDSVAPVAPVVLSPASGASTANVLPPASGTAEPGSTVRVLDGLSAFCTATADGQGHWSCSPAAPLTEGPHALTATATDTAGNVSAASSVVAFSVDTSAPSAPTFTAPTEGAALSSARPTFSGTAEAGTQVTVLEGATVVCTATADAQGHWSCDATADLVDGAHALSARATDAAGNTSPGASVDVDVDTSAPDTTAGALPAHVAQGTVEIRVGASDASPSSGAGHFLCAVDGAAAVPCTDNGQGGVEIAGLSDGPHVVSIAAVDAAGNVDATPATVSFTVDTAAPAAPQVSTPQPGSDQPTQTPTFSGASEPGTTVTVLDGTTVVCTATADDQGNWSCAALVPLADGVHDLAVVATDAAGNVSPAASAPFRVVVHAPSVPTLRSPAPGSSTPITTPTFAGTAEPGTTVSVVDQGSGQVLCVAVADAQGQWSCVPTLAMDEGPHTLVIRSTNVFGETDASPVTVTVDHTAPVAPGGGQPDHVTVVSSQPVLSGTAEPGSTIVVTDANGAVICTATVDALGDWRCTPMQPLTPGAQALTVQASDAAGNGGPTSTLVFSVDTSTPAIVSPASGGLLGTATPVVSGTAPAGTAVTVYAGVTAACTATADAQGAWSCTSSALPEGLTVLTAVAADTQGSASPTSASVAVSVDTIAPVAPALSAPADQSDLSQARPTFAGTAEPGSRVAVLDGTTVVCTATADAQGAWSCTPSADLGDGAHALVAVSTDAAGNASAPSTGVTVTIDTQAPAIPVVTGPAPGSTVGSPLAVTGTAEAGSVMVVTLDGQPLCTVTADVQGNWSCSVSGHLADGSHVVTATATDGAGNASAVGSASFTVDTRVPATPVLGAPGTGLDTNQAPTQAKGQATPGDTVTVSLDGQVVCTVTADATGAWTCSLPTPMVDGDHTVSATATGPGGVSSPPVGSTFTVDTTPPAAPAITSPADGSSEATLPMSMSGTAEPGSTVTVTLDGQSVCTTTADAQGNWTCMFSGTTTDGEHTLSATTTDRAGNVSRSASVTFSLHRVAVTTGTSGSSSSTGSTGSTGSTSSSGSTGHGSSGSSGHGSTGSSGSTHGSTGHGSSGSSGGTGHSSSSTSSSGSTTGSSGTGGRVVLESTTGSGSTGLAGLGMGGGGCGCSNTDGNALLALLAVLALPRRRVRK